MRLRGLAIAFWGALLAFAGCERASEPSAVATGAGSGMVAHAGGVVFHEGPPPPLLSDWGLVRVTDGVLTLAPGSTPYDLATPLFTDYAHKLRAVWMPPGTQAVYRPDDVPEFPVGTVITKTFYYPIAEGTDEAGGTAVARADVSPPGAARGELALADVRLIETRLLVRREAGWDAIPYVWDGDEGEARLARAGAVQTLLLVDAATPGAAPVSFPYVVPDKNQCAGCHAVNNTTRALTPIGPKPRHLNGDHDYGAGPVNQIDYWSSTGVWTGAPEDLADVPRSAAWRDQSDTLEARARAYLDINCSHCHSSVGPADTSGLWLDPHTPLGPKLGLCKPPIAAGAGSGGLTFDIVPGEPDASILAFRMTTDAPDKRMPELGRSVSHAEGLALVREWISSLEGECVSG